MAAPATTPYHNPYLSAREPVIYGEGVQEEYSALAEKIINETAHEIRQGLEKGQKPTDVFLSLLPKLQKKRHEIAVRHATADAELFGFHRASKEAKFGEKQSGYFSPYTALSDPYAAYNAVCMQQLHALLSPLKHTPESFTDKKVRSEETILGRRCTFEVEVLENIDIKEKGLDRRLIESELPSLSGGLKAPEIYKDYEGMNALRLSHPSFYQRLTTYAFMVELDHIFPSSKLVFTGPRTFVNKGHPKSAHILGTLSMEMPSGTSLPLMRCITWLYQDMKTDPVDRMKEESTVVIIHQDPFLVEETLETIAGIFAGAISWDHKTDTTTSLKERVALFRFCYAHCMPSARGDGAIGDWIELAIYRLHGFIKTHYNPEKFPCFEPLASLSLSRYITNYDSVITVE